jgi:hypothetical protein
MRPAVPWNLGTSTTQGRRITIQQNARCPEVCESHPHTSGLIRSRQRIPGTGRRRPWTRWPPSLSIVNEHPLPLSPTGRVYGWLHRIVYGFFHANWDQKVQDSDFLVPVSTWQSGWTVAWALFRPKWPARTEKCPALPLPTGSQSYPRRANVIRRGIGVIHGASRLLTRNPGCFRRRNFIHGKAELSGAIHGCFGVDNATGAVNNLETPWIALLRDKQPGVGMDRVALAWITLPCDG